MKDYLNSKLKINNSGFTLIELLIVIAIIGVLATLLMVNFIGVRQRARDAQRKADIRELQAALEIYRSDIGQYPDSSANYPAGCGTGAQLTNGLTPPTIYMQTIPCDPNGTGASNYNGGKYYYSGGGSNYILCACLENSADSQGVSNDATCKLATNCSTNYYYKVVNP